MKKCTKCLKIFPESDFRKDSGHKDGLRSECRFCSNKRVREWNKNNPEKKRSAVKRSYLKYRDSQLLYKKEYYKNRKDYLHEWKNNQIKNPVFTELPQEWYYFATQISAKKRKIEFNLSLEEFQKSYVPKCALSGVELYCVATGVQSPGNQNASIDRIDSSKGYESSNIQWVDQEINRLKSNFPQDIFIQMCKKVAKNN